MKRWCGKVAVVTGAHAGIGAAIALKLASCGMNVVGLDIKGPEKPKKEKKGQGCLISKKCDVADPKNIKSVFEWIEKDFGGVDVMVNNAGALYNGQTTVVGDTVLTEEQIVNTVSTNITGLILFTRYAVKSMKKRKVDGHIVNVSSVVGHYIPTTPTFNVYPLTKHAVTAFKGSLTNEFAKFNCKIKVTVGDSEKEGVLCMRNLNPGLVVTKLAAGLVKQLKVPVLQPPDIAEGVIYALSTPPHVNVSSTEMDGAEDPPDSGPPSDVHMLGTSRNPQKWSWSVRPGPPKTKVYLA